MLEFSEVMREEDPSSAASTEGAKEPYNLPEDPQAEESIALEGYTTDDLIDAAFQGIDLVTYKGDYLSRTLLASSINSAIATAEQMFDIAIGKRLIEDEVHDYEGMMLNQFQHTYTYLRPLIKVTKISYMLGNSELLKVPGDWVQLDKKAGAITIFPVSGSVQPIMPAIGSTIPYYGNFRYMPNGLRLTYEAGMDKKDVPANLIDWIAKRAAISVFEVWGDQIIGAGIAGSSLSIDGAAQSIDTTQSAMYGGASARISEYRRDLELLTPVIRRHYARINSAVL